MNGLSLLIALATVGVDVGWESGPNKQLVYTVRIESLVHEQLRDGKAIVSPVEANDRGIRKFRIAMGPKPAVERTSRLTANEVQYGWRPSVDDPRQVDYFVQVLPERLETLAQGIPLECEVHPDVPEVHYIYFFQGNAQLPRELPVGLQTAPLRSQVGRGTGEAVRPAGNSVTQPSSESRFGAQGFEGSRFGNDNTAPTSASDAGTSTTQRTDRGWREETPTKSGGAATYGPDPPNTYRQQQNTLAGDRYNQSRENLIQVPDPRQQQQYGYDDRYRDDRYASRTEAGRPPATNPYPPTYRNDPPQLSPPAAEDETTKQLVALIKEQQEMLKQQQTDALTKQVLSPGYTATTPPGQTQVSPPNSMAADEGLRTPLVVTMLALFASLCANAYIGWLAWSFFWRFRNSASDLARAQTAATMRSAT